MSLCSFLFRKPDRQPLHLVTLTEWPRLALHWYTWPTSCRYSVAVDHQSINPKSRGEICWCNTFQSPGFCQCQTYLVTKHLIKCWCSFFFGIPKKPLVFVSGPRWWSWPGLIGFTMWAIGNGKETESQHVATFVQKARLFPRIES